MTLKEIREKAKGLKIKGTTRLGKDELIPAIQNAEGNSDCWKRIADCGQDDCCWQEDCQEAASGAARDA